jgi:hypothetical protein
MSSIHAGNTASIVAATVGRVRPPKRLFQRVFTLQVRRKIPVCGEEGRKSSVN